MGHDQRFKELLRHFLRPLVERFFPEVAEHLDLGNPEFLDKELFEDPPEGGHRIADVVAKVTSREGEPELLLIHVEVQARRRRDVPARMFDYYALLRRTYRLPIAPVLIYLRGGRSGSRREEFRVRLFGREMLRFRYDCLALGKLDASDHVRSEEALLSGLAALMDRSKVAEPLRLRLSMLDRIGKSGYDPYRKFLLTNLVEVYFELQEDEVERFETALAIPEFKEARKMATSHVDRIMEEGRKEGRQEGRNEGAVLAKQGTLLRLLSKRFGTLPEELVSRIQGTTSIEALDAALDQVLDASRLDEIEIPGPR